MTHIERPTGQRIAALALVTAPLLLGGCGVASMFSTDPQEDQYQRARTLPPLEVPPDLTLASTDDALIVPGVDPGTAPARSGVAGRSQAPMAAGETYPYSLGPPDQPAVANNEASRHEDAGTRLRRTTEGHVRVEIEEDFANAWREVGEALASANIEVEDMDRSRGLYFIRYPVAEERDPSFAKMLTFWRGPGSTTDKRFLVLVQAGEGRSNVLVFNDREQLESSVIGHEILNKIHDQLI